MKILTITNKFPPNAFGGAEIAAAITATELENLGHTVKVVTDNDLQPNFNKQSPSKISRSNRPIPNQLIQRARGIYKKTQFHLKDCFGKCLAENHHDEIIDFNADICHIHNVQGIGYRTFEYVSRINLPTLITFHDYSLTCINQSRFYKGNPCEGDHFVCKATKIFKKYYLGKIKILGVCAPSRYLVDNLKNEIPKHSRFNRQWDLPLQLRPIKAKEKSNSEILRIGFIGRLDESKGAHLLPRIVENCNSRTHFIIAGSGKLEADLKDHFASRKNVEMLGFCKGHDLIKFYSSVDLLIVPSQWNEIYSLVIREAMSQGVPCIVSDCGALSELVSEQTGWLLPRNNTNLWIQKINHLTDARREIAEKSLRSIEKLTVETNVKSATTCIEMYENLIT